MIRKRISAGRMAREGTVSAQTKERKRKCTTILFCRLPLWGTVRNVFTNVVFLMHTISMELEVAESATSSDIGIWLHGAIS